MTLEESIATILPPDQFFTPAESMMYTILAIFQEYAFGDNIFVGKEPNDDDSITNTITLFDSGGNEQDDFEPIDTNSVQIRSRSTSYKGGYRSIHRIKLALQSKRPYNVGAKRIIGMWIENPPTHIGKDQRENSIFTMNIMVKSEDTFKGHRGVDANPQQSITGIEYEQPLIIDEW